MDLPEKHQGLMDLFDGYIRTLGGYARSGMSKDSLITQTYHQKDDFIRVTNELGYTADDVKGYLRVFEDVVETINDTPRVVEVQP